MGVLTQTVRVVTRLNSVIAWADWLAPPCRGFRSAFDRGCLSLWFNFRRNVSDFVCIDKHDLTTTPVLPEIRLTFTLCIYISVGHQMSINRSDHVPITWYHEHYLEIYHLKCTTDTLSSSLYTLLVT